MKTLTHGMHGFWRTATAGAGLLALILAPAVFQAEEKPTFPHDTHIEEGAACTDCHALDAEPGEPKIKLAFCEDCHEDGAPGMTLAAKGRPLKMKFPHDVHTEAAECADCHDATLKGEQKPCQPLVTVERCFACHKENDVETPEQACKVCHGVDQRRVAPADHGKAWRLRHGRESQWSALAGHGQDCGFCHTRSACSTCHQNTRPQSHTPLWRIRTHGRAAAFDRDTCKTCHETGTCIACHRRTEPASHRGAWRSTHGLVAGSKDDARCTVCHSPAQCTACHSGESR